SSRVISTSVLIGWRGAAFAAFSRRFCPLCERRGLRQVRVVPSPDEAARFLSLVGSGKCVGAGADGACDDAAGAVPRWRNDSVCLGRRNLDGGGARRRRA